MTMHRPLELLRRAHTASRPLVLGLSGGPDSMALFELLLHHRDAAPFELHIAHVNHGWRKESAQEAKAIEALCQKHGCFFHLRSLGKAPASDLENAARLERLAFFLEVVEKSQAEALCLAHHSDDLIETVLKRLFEGAPIERVGAFGFESFIGSLRIWRPFIDLAKEEIEAFGFDDPTNRDPRFLRARLRRHLIPELERQFGKSLRPALRRLSSRSHALDAYLEKRASRWLGGPALPLAIDFSGAEPLEIEYVLSRRTDLPAELRADLAGLLAGLVEHRSFELGQRRVIVHRGCFLMTLNWQIVWEEGGELCEPTPWHELWSRGGRWPVGVGRLIPAGELPARERKKWYAEPLFKRVPSPLRPYLPVGEGPLVASCAICPVDLGAKIV